MARSEQYATKARAAILDCLRRNRSGTVSAGDILRELQERQLSVNRATVYRYLDRLCAEHTVIKYADSSCEKAVYQFVDAGRRCDEHLHLKCVRCGRLIHLDCGFMDELQRHIQQHHGFLLQCEGSLLNGICEQCRMADAGAAGRQ